MKHSRMMFLMLALVLAVALNVSGAGAATIVINNLDSAGEGFNDPTPVAPVGGNAGVTLGAQRLIAFTYAAQLAGECLVSNVPIIVNAQMNALTCTPTSAVLGSAGATQVWRDFAGAPLASTWYSSALANSLYGADLDGGTTADISAQFNSSINGDPSCLASYNWYYGLDGLVPGVPWIDFVTVVEHEICHGLGFQTFHNVSTGAYLGSPSDPHPDSYLVWMERHGAAPSAYTAMTNAQRSAANKSDPNLHFIGPNVQANIGVLTAGTSGGHVRLHGPAALAPGSSVSHWSTALTPNELMEPNYTGPNHSRSLALELLKDVGWVVNCEPPVSVAITSFDARAVDRGVELRASFASTFDAVFVNVYRAEGGATFNAIATESQGGRGSFTYVDETAVAGHSYKYQIGVVDQDGEFMSPTQEVRLPTVSVQLLQNTPNPFNPTTSIRFVLPASEHVTLTVYDVNGRLVRTLVDGVEGNGSHDVKWDGRDAAGSPVGSGIYFYRLQAGKFSESKKMVMLK